MRTDLHQAIDLKQHEHSTGVATVLFGYEFVILSLLQCFTTRVEEGREISSLTQLEKNVCGHVQNRSRSSVPPDITHVVIENDEDLTIIVGIFCGLICICQSAGNSAFSSSWP